ncbi:MAG: Flp family type IVb pilin [Nitrospira sp.]|nr:Flp family type IVb pilin [Nitrospira sp.]
MLNAIRQFVKEEDGASAVEYAILLGIMGAAVATTVGLLSGAIDTSVKNALDHVTAANAS